MKKLISLLLMLCALPTFLMAQLEVDLWGRTILGTSSYSPTTNSELLTLRAELKDSCGISFSTNPNSSPFQIYRKSGYTWLGNFSSTKFCGMRIGSSGAVQIRHSNSYLLPDMAPIPAATLSVSNLLLPAICATGKICSTSGIIASAAFDEASKCYTAYYIDPAKNKVLNFYVKADGSVYAKNGFIQSSDLSKKENVDSISPQNALHALTSLHGVSFSYKGSNQPITQPELSQTYPRNLNMNEENGLMNEVEQIPDAVLAQMNEEQSRKRIGLIAQEVEKVIPEVVRTLPDGSKGIMYTDLIGLIVEGMKEIQTNARRQDARIDSLEQTVKFYKSLIPAPEVLPAADPLPATPRNGKSQEGAIASSLASQVTLYQNVPNPFASSTEIVYALPQGYENGAICIHDLNGQILKQYALSSLQGKITIQGNEFEPGTYIYTLVSGGHILASRKMVKS